MAVVVAASNGGVAILALLVLVPLGLLSVFKPRESWRTFESWKYKNPDANEPSDTEYGLRQVGGAVTVIIAIVIVIAAASSGGDEPEPYSGVDVNYLLEQSRERLREQARTSTVPRFTTPTRVTTTGPTNPTSVTTAPTANGTASTDTVFDPASTGPATIGPASTGPGTKKIVTGSLTVSNPDTTDQMVDRYLVVTDGEGRVVSRTPLSVEVPARSSIEIDPTPYIDLDLMVEGTYFWSIGASASGTDPINSGIFAVSAAPR